jgi:mycothione reductase
VRCLRGDLCEPGMYPPKMLGYTADLAELCQRAPQFGLSITPKGVDWSSIRNRVFSRVDETSRDGHRERAASANVTVYEGHGRFAGPGELVVNDQFRISAQQVVIATGGRPSVPKVVLDSGVAFETSDTIMRLEALPASMVILGGGSVAVEMAHLFSSLGVRIHIVESAEKLLATLDVQISRRFTKEASARWNLHLGATVAEVRNHKRGRAGP